MGPGLPALFFFLPIGVYLALVSFSSFTSFPCHTIFLFSFLIRHFYSPAQLVRGFTPGELLD